MYILLSDKNTVSEIIPDEHPSFPGIPVSARYTAEFVAKLKHFPDDTNVAQNWIYDPESDTFSAPKVEEADTLEEIKV